METQNQMMEEIPTQMEQIEKNDSDVISVPYCSDEVLEKIIKANPGKKIINPIGKELRLDESREE